MVSLAGLSAAYPGYQHAQGVDLQNRGRQLQNTDLETEQAGQAAFGNTLKMFQQQVPGAQPLGQSMQMSQGPQAPMPGQASVPNPAGPMGAPPMRPPQPMQVQMPPGGGQPMGGPPMQQPGMPPQGPQGGMPRQPMQQGQQVGGGQPQGMAGQLTWQGVLGAVAKANPGAPPQVIAAAVSRFMPIMNSQAQMEWKQMQLHLQQQNVENRLEIAKLYESGRGQRADQRSEDKGLDRETKEVVESERRAVEREREQGRGQRSDTASQDRRYGVDTRSQDRSADRDTRTDIASERRQVEREREEGRTTRAGLSADTKKEIAKLSSDTRREIAELNDSGRSGRTALSIDARKEIAKLNAGVRSEIEGMKEEGRDKRFVAGEEGRNSRLDTTEGGKNLRQRDAEGARDDRAKMSADTRLQLGKMSTEARREITGILEGGRDARATMSDSTRRELGQMNVAARKELSDAVEMGRNERSAAGIASREETSEANRKLREGLAERSASQRKDQFETREKRLGDQFDRREGDRLTDRELRTKKDALSAGLQRERNAIFAAGTGVSGPKLKTALEAAQKRHDEALIKLDHPTAKKAPNGKWYVPDPKEPGKYLEVVQ